MYLHLFFYLFLNFYNSGGHRRPVPRHPRWHRHVAAAGQDVQAQFWAPQHAPRHQKPRRPQSSGQEEVEPRDTQFITQDSENHDGAELFLNSIRLSSNFHLNDFPGSCLKTGQHSIFVIIRKIKRIIYVCWIPNLLEILKTVWRNILFFTIIIGNEIQ